jgi:hypothetical protein
MHIEILGLDKYVVASLSRQLHQPLIALTNIQENNLFFSAQESLLFHKGVDQNAWHTIIRVHLDETLIHLKQEISDLITGALKDHTIHMHLSFYPQSKSNHLDIIQSQYPRFITESNEVKIQPSDDETEQEIYHGNIFAGKEKDLEAIQSNPKKLVKKKKPS